MSVWWVDIINGFVMVLLNLKNKNNSFVQ